MIMAAITEFLEANAPENRSVANQRKVATGPIKLYKITSSAMKGTKEKRLRVRFIDYYRQKDKSITMGEFPVK
ncbi:hypothetical protein [Paenibacillus sp. FSL W8-0194]|uniref:hypothetical protein n=1 Tax=Paenibacillus sp. FSL W8-0194 TaxID=2921711 RepID=UPI0030DDCCAD